MEVPFLDFSHADLKPTILKAVSDLLDRGQFILGEEVGTFEQRLSKKLDSPFVVSVNSGTDALILALKCLDIGPGDEVITVSNSFFATANAIRFIGAKPVFVDVGEDLLMNTSLIEKHISKRTRAIMPVHLTGKPVDMDALMKVAQAYKLEVVEDCAQAIGARWKNRCVGTFGVGAFSLHPLKNLAACGDGGFLTTDRKDLFEKIKKLRNHGLQDRDHLEMVGINSRLDEIQASILNVKLDDLDRIVSERRKNAALYDRELRPHLGKKLLSVPSDSKNDLSVYHTYVIRVADREKCQRFLQSRGIETKIHYPIPIHLQPPYLDSKISLPNTETFADQILSLPIHQHLSEKQVLAVSEALRTFVVD